MLSGTPRETEAEPFFRSERRTNSSWYRYEHLQPAGFLAHVARVLTRTAKRLPGRRSLLLLPEGPVTVPFGTLLCAITHTVTRSRRLPTCFPFTRQYPKRSLPAPVVYPLYYQVFICGNPFCRLSFSVTPILNQGFGYKPLVKKLPSYIFLRRKLSLHR